MAPRPPAPDTAATSCGAYTEPMPPSAMGCSICKRSHTGVRIIISPFGAWPMLARGRARARDLGEAAMPECQPLQRCHQPCRVDDVAGGRRHGVVLLLSDLRLRRRIDIVIHGE